MSAEQPNTYEIHGLRQVKDTITLISQLNTLTPEEFFSLYGAEINEFFSQRSIADGATPVMVCAYDEINQIGKLAYGLKRSGANVKLVVVDNNSTDGTGDYAEALGAQVVSESQQGLIHALRRGFRHFAEMGYDQPILLTDADTVPVPSWPTTMTNFARIHIPYGGESSGIIKHFDEEKGFDDVEENRKATAAMRKKNIALTTGNLVFDALTATVRKPNPHGPNSVVMPDQDGRILSALAYELPIRPEGLAPTDIAVRDIVKQQRGKIKFCFKPDAIVVTSGRRYDNVLSVIERAVRPNTSRRKNYKS